MLTPEGEVALKFMFQYIISPVLLLILIESFRSYFSGPLRRIVKFDGKFYVQWRMYTFSKWFDIAFDRQLNSGMVLQNPFDTFHEVKIFMEIDLFKFKERKRKKKLDKVVLDNEGNEIN